MIPKTLAGDIGLSASKTFISKGIRFFGKLQTGNADRSHAFSCIGDQQVIEALVRVRINDLDKYADEDIEIYRLPLDEEDRAAFRRGMCKIAGDSYGWFKIPLHALDSAASYLRNFCRKLENRKPVFWFTSKLGISGFKDCSQLTVFGLHKFTKYRLRHTGSSTREVDWRCVSPDYLQDLLHCPHNGAKLLHKQSGK